MMHREIAYALPWYSFTVENQVCNCNSLTIKTGVSKKASFCVLLKETGLGFFPPLLLTEIACVVFYWKLLSNIKMRLGNNCRKLMGKNYRCISNGADIVKGGKRGEEQIQESVLGNACEREVKQVIQTVVQLH